MSFALEVKEEIFLHTFTKQQKQALLAGFIKNNGEIIIINNSQQLKLTTISNRIARNLFTICKEFFDGTIEMKILNNNLQKKQRTFEFYLVGDVLKFLKKIKVIDNNNQKIINYNFNSDTSIIRAYIAGVFIAVGSVNSPLTSNYHLELQFKESLSALEWVNILKQLDFDFKVLKRNSGRYVCYLKKSLKVSEFLKLIDTPKSVLNFENERISRDIYNVINRVNNIDISNQTKLILTSEKQIKQINFIKDNKLEKKLSLKANLLMNLRIDNPDSSYTELADKMSELGYQITKSGVSNLFKNIEKLAMDNKILQKPNL